MRTSLRLLLLPFLAAAALAVPLAAGADVGDAVSSFTYSRNMHPMGYSPREVPFSSGIFNSDLTFWGRRAYQGTYEGFRIIDITEPDNPIEIENFTGCVQGTTTGNQGDVVVWGNILVRSWNSPAPAGGAFCGGFFTPPGQEGLHVFDISDPTHPVAVAFVATPCGSHTATGVPDGERLLVYSNSSSASTACRGFDIVQVPLAHPENASYLRFEPSGDPSVGGGLDNLVTIDPPSSAAGVYGATGASFGPAPTDQPVSGDVVLVNDGSANPTLGCNPLVGFPAGAIALVDRGTCAFVVKVKNAQDAGAVAVIVANNVPGDPITMGGDDPTIVIPSVMVSLDNGNTIKAGLPATGSIRRNPNATRPCHDSGVILGAAMKVACAGGNGFAVWSLGGAEGGSLTDPELLYSHIVPGVSIAHSAAFTWDGQFIVFGHEPGGGGQPRCQETSATVDKTLFFFEAGTGEPAGEFVLPRPQTAFENCTWHNYNVVPTSRRYVLVAGNYQSGISVVDFTNPANAREIAFADPAPLSPDRLVVGGDWSTYWYNGHIYESDIRRGLIVWRLSDPAVAGAMMLGHLNPQTEETSFGGG
jgi:PA domain/LVIVD repeat